MADASILYGNPEDSPLTSAYTGGTNWNAIGGLVSAGFSAFGGLYSAFAQQDQNNKTIANIRAELARNKKKILYDWRKSNAENLVSFWNSGINPTSGSAAGTLASNKNIVDSNIEDMTRAAENEIANLKSSSKNGIIGSIIGGVGQLAGAALAFSDRRLKRDLVEVGKANNGLPIYLGRYTEESGLDDGKFHLFLVAQDVIKEVPNAVVRDKKTGYMMVDYLSALL